MARTEKTVKRTFIRQWREHRKLSLERVAERLSNLGVKITHGSLSRIERGLQPYNQRQLEALANALQCAPADLLMRDPTDPEGIWSIWETLRPPQKRQLVAIGETLARTGSDS